MKTLPRPGRRVRHLLSRPTLLAAVLTILGSSGTALAATATAWPFEWRPNWIPGDPLEAPKGFVEPSWIALRPQTPGMLVALDSVTRRPIKPSAAQRAALADGLHAGSLLAPDGLLPTVRIFGGGELITAE